MMGEHWAERTKTPELEFQEHVDSTGKVPAPSPALLRQLHFLVKLLHAAKDEPADAQRVLRQVLPGAELVVAEAASGAVERPHLLACDRASHQAYLILPGTRCITDL